jgi:hypothetical protein
VTPLLQTRAGPPRRESGGRFLRPLAWLLLLPIAGCVKVSPLSDTQLLEAFTGSLSLTPLLDVYSPLNVPGLVTISAAAKGEVLITGITTNEPLRIGLSTEQNFIAESLRIALTMVELSEEEKQRLGGLPAKVEAGSALIQGMKKIEVVPTISGLTATVQGKRELAIARCEGLNRYAAVLKPLCSGRMVLDGSRLRTHRDHPIIIRINLKALLASFLDALGSFVPKPEGAKKTEALQLFNADLAAHFGRPAEEAAAMPLADFLWRTERLDIARENRYMMGQARGGTEPSPDGDKEKQKKDPAIDLNELLARFKQEIEKIQEDDQMEVWRITFEGAILTVL